MSLVSGNIRFMQIFTEVPWRGASNDSRVIENIDFQGFRTLVFGTLGNEANIIIYIVSQKTRH